MRGRSQGWPRAPLAAKRRGRAGLLCRQPRRSGLVAPLRWTVRRLGRGPASHPERGCEAPLAGARPSSSAFAAFVSQECSPVQPTALARDRGFAGQPCHLIWPHWKRTGCVLQAMATWNRRIRRSPLTYARTTFRSHPVSEARCWRSTSSSMRSQPRTILPSPARPACPASERRARGAEGARATGCQSAPFEASPPRRPAQPLRHPWCAARRDSKARSPTSVM